MANMQGAQPPDNHAESQISEKKGVFDAKFVEELRAFRVKDSEGKEHPFETLIDAKEGEKCLVIFIR